MGLRFGGWGHVGRAVKAVPRGVSRRSVGRPADRLRKRLGRAGPARGFRDPGQVAEPTAGHGDVDAGSGGGGFDDGDAGVDGDALVAVASGDPAELDVAGDVGGREAYGSALGSLTVRSPLPWTLLTVQVWRLRTSTPVAVSRVASLRRVATRSPTNATVPSAKATFQPERVGSRRFWISTLIARAVPAEAVVMATVRPRAVSRSCWRTTWSVSVAGWTVRSRPASA